MSDLRTAAQQALEAMEREAEYYLQEHSEYNEVLLPAIDALRAALAEPVALNDGRLWQYPDGSIGIGSAPPQRKSLTEDEIAQAMYRADAIVTGPMQFRFAREIERAHGIT